MKRIFRTGMLTVACALATGVAFAEMVSNRPKAFEEVYTWNRTAGEALPGEQSPYVGTKTAAQNYFGCSGTVDICAIGVPGSLGLPNEVIYQY